MNESAINTSSALEYIGEQFDHYARAIAMVRTEDQELWHEEILYLLNLIERSHGVDVFMVISAHDRLARVMEQLRAIAEYMYKHKDDDSVGMAMLHKESNIKKLFYLRTGLFEVYHFLRRTKEYRLEFEQLVVSRINGLDKQLADCSELKKKKSEQSSLISAVARRMDEAFLAIDQINMAIARLDRRVESLETQTRSLLADRLAVSR